MFSILFFFSRNYSTQLNELLRANSRVIKMSSKQLQTNSSKKILTKNKSQLAELKKNLQFTTSPTPVNDQTNQTHKIQNK